MAAHNRLDRIEERARLVEMRIAATASREEWAAAMELFDRAEPERHALREAALDQEFLDDMAAFGFEVEIPS